MPKPFLIAIAACALIAIAGEIETRPATCRAIAYDTAGNYFVAGQGDTPQAALQGAVWPARIASYEMDCRR